MNQNPESNCSHQNHDCSQTLEKVELALDGALSLDEQKAFLTELKDCSYCLDKYNIEKDFKEFLCARINRKECNNSLATSIRSIIETQSPRA